MEKKYNVIYADPAWKYKNKKTGGTMLSGADAHYDTMTIEEICKMPIKKMAQKNAILFMWVTVPLLPEFLPVLDAWGFKYKTMLTWRKTMSLGLGYWFRGQCEHLIVATKGTVKATRMQVPNFYQSKAERHSKKPDYFRQLIDQSASKLGYSDKIELFARQESDGWEVFGNQVDNSILLS